MKGLIRLYKAKPPGSNNHTKASSKNHTRAISPKMAPKSCPKSDQKVVQKNDLTGLLKGTQGPKSPEEAKMLSAQTAVGSVCGEYSKSG